MTGVDPEAQSLMGYGGGQGYPDDYSGGQVPPGSAGPGLALLEIRTVRSATFCNSVGINMTSFTSFL